jgi:hypothetical protein
MTSPGARAPSHAPTANDNHSPHYSEPSWPPHQTSQTLMTDQTTRGSSTARRRKGDAPQRSPASRSDLERAIWDREMRRLRMATRLLSAVLLALVARMIISGPRFATELSAAIITLILLATLCLTRRGRRLRPPQPLNPRTSGESTGRRGGRHTSWIDAQSCLLGMQMTTEVGRHRRRGRVGRRRGVRGNLRPSASPFG